MNIEQDFKRETLYINRSRTIKYLSAYVNR